MIFRLLLVGALAFTLLRPVHAQSLVVDDFTSGYFSLDRTLGGGTLFSAPTALGQRRRVSVYPFPNPPLGVHYNLTLKNGLLTVTDSDFGSSTIEYGAIGWPGETHALYDLHLDLRDKAIHIELDGLRNVTASPFAILLPVRISVFSFDRYNPPEVSQAFMLSSVSSRQSRRFNLADFEYMDSQFDLSNVSGLRIWLESFPTVVGDYHVKRISIEPAQSDVTSQVSITERPERAPRETGISMRRLLLKNLSGQALAGPLHLVLHDLPFEVGLEHEALAEFQQKISDTTIQILRGVEVELGLDGLWAPDETLAVRLVFRAAAGQLISFVPEVRAVIP